MNENKMTIIEKNLGDLLNAGDYFHRTLQEFTCYLISEKIETLSEENNVHYEKLKSEIEKRFQESKTKFFSISIKNGRCITICFENNCVIFYINAKCRDENSDGCNGIGDIYDPKNSSEKIISEKMKIFIKKILSRSTKTELLFSSNKEEKMFRGLLGDITNTSISSSKTKEINEEIQNFLEGMKRNFQTKIKKCEKPMFKAIVIYIIRRNYYESKSFNDPLFFEENFDHPQETLKTILDRIDELDLDNHKISFPEIKEKINFFGRNKLRYVENERIISLRKLKVNSYSSVYLVIYIPGFKLLVEKRYMQKDTSSYIKEKKIYEKLDIEHPNILKCYGYNETTKNDILFYEFMSNDTLKNLMSLNSDNVEIISEGMKYKIFFSLIFALEYLHKKKCIHQDLKPDNIFIDHDYNFFVGDFNVSFYEGTEKWTKSNNIGSSKYSSPELLKGEYCSYSTDYYSLGIIMYEIFHGKILESFNLDRIFPDFDNKYGILYYIFNKSVREKNEEAMDSAKMMYCLQYNKQMYRDFIKFSKDQYNINNVGKYCLIFIEDNDLIMTYYYLIYFIHECLLMENKTLNPNIMVFYKKCQKILELKNFSFINFLHGFFYLSEESGFPKDVQKTIYYYELSAKQNDQNAQFNLGSIYQSGEEGIPINIKKAIYYYELSANQNNAIAKNNLGNIYYSGEGEICKDIQKAIHYYELSAEQNEPNAQYNLGNIYLSGKDGVPIDIKKAIYYYTLSANQNNPSAQNNLGTIYLTGVNGIQKDIRKAIHYCELSANQNNSIAQKNLGFIYYLGDGGIPKDIKEAIHYFELSAKQNNIRVLNTLGSIYHSGEGGITKDIQKAIYYYELSAKQNDSTALKTLGFIYHSGEGGIIKDIQKAIYYYELSAKQNDPSSLDNLGFIYLSGDGGITKDIKKAIHYYELSAKQNDSTALKTLGFIYHSGEGGIIKDIQKAIYYYELSAKQNDPSSLDNLGFIYLSGDGGITKDIKKAIYYYELSAKQNDSTSLNNLGSIYYFGEGGIPKDIKKAIHYYELAAKQNYSIALKNLGFIYHSGEGGILRDIQRAIRYYELSAIQNNSTSLNNLGTIYHSGVGGIRKDLQKAIHYYELAAKQNNSIAFKNLGFIYHLGEGGIPKDIKKAIYYYELSSKQNDVMALNYLGFIYYTGDEGTPKDVKKAIHYYELSAKQSDPSALNILGTIYRLGEGGIPKDINIAIHYFELSANLNYSIAQNTLGTIYHSGTGGASKDIEKAIHYYEISAKQKDHYAQFNLGIIYHLGEEGIPINIKKAIYYYELSANQNNAFATNNLGNIYYSGEGEICKDIQKAIHYFELSSEQNEPNAQYNLGNIYLSGKDGVPIDIKKAGHYYKLSADNGNHNSQFIIGVYYHLYQNSKEKAIQYYKGASNFDIYGAKNNLGVIYLQMAEEEEETNLNLSREHVGMALEYLGDDVEDKKGLSFYNLFSYKFNRLLANGNKEKAVDLVNQWLKPSQMKDEEKIYFAKVLIPFYIGKNHQVRLISNKSGFHFYVSDIFKNMKIQQFQNIENCSNNHDFYSGLNS